MVTTKAAIAKKLGSTDDKKAVVVEEHHKTVTYEKDAPANEEQNTRNQGTNPNQNSANSTNQNRPVVFQNQATLPQNRLAVMFDEMREAEEFEGETFYALITRNADLMQDSFRKPCLTPQNFPTMQITSNMMLEFIPLLQKHNGNSGGRFNIIICDAQGDSLNIGMNNFVISDPVIEDKPTDSNNSQLDVIALFEKMNQASEKRFEQMLAAMRPQEDEFTKLVKEKMRNDFLNPPQAQQSAFKPEEIMANVMSSMAVTQAMAEGFAKMFTRSETPSERDKGLVETLLTNDIFLERAQNIYEQTTNVIADIATARMNPNAPAQHSNIEYEEEIDTGYPPLPPQETQPTQEQTEEAMKREQLIKDILLELEGNNPLDNDNEMLLRLRNENQDLNRILIIMCKTMPFEKLLQQLSEIVPDVFNQYVVDGQPTEQGEYVSRRLHEFYEFMKTQD